MSGAYLKTRNSIGETMKYSVYLIDANGKGSYLSVKGRTYWSKPTALKYAQDVASTKKPVFDAVIVEVDDDFSFVMKTYTREEKS